jgi:hypothetical protein
LILKILRHAKTTFRPGARPISGFFFSIRPPRKSPSAFLADIHIYVNNSRIGQQ